MVFVLSYVFAESHHLSGTGFSSDIKSRHANRCGCSAVVHHAPHSFDDDMMKIFRDREHLWIRARAIKRLKAPAGPQLEWSSRIHRPQLLQNMRNIKAAAH